MECTKFKFSIKPDIQKICRLDRDSIEMLPPGESNRYTNTTAFKNVFFLLHNFMYEYTS